jgi:translocation and assembly module TamA
MEEPGLPTAEIVLKFIKTGTFAHSGHVRTRRRVRTASFCLSTVLAIVLAVSPAHAFKLFGFGFFEPEVEEEAQPIDPVRYQASIRVEGSAADMEALQERLTNASELIGKADKPVSGSIGVLYETAHYSGTVTILLNGQPLRTLPIGAEFAGSSPVNVEILVQSGAPFVFGKVRITDESGKEYNPADFDLVSGTPANSALISSAEGKLIKAFNDEGRPFAKIADREAVADHDTNSLDVTITANSGAIAPFGQTNVTGTEAVDREFTRYMAGIEPGKIYSAKDIEAANKRLQSLEVFSSVAVRAADTADADGSVPVDVSVVERKHRYFGLGATLSTDEGAGFEGYWGHRNLFGKAEKLRLQGSVSHIGQTRDFRKLNYNAALLFEKPGVLGPPSKFTASVKLASENEPAYDELSGQVAAGVSYDVNEHQTASVGVALDYSKITTATETQSYLTASIPLEYVFDYRNDPLNPSSGYRALFAAAPSYEIFSKAVYGKLRTELSAYRALDDSKRFVLAGRVTAGSILGAGLGSIPANQRFYAGGGGSVRGYAFQGIGPRDAANNPTGGLSLFEASAELRGQVTEKFGVVAFLDAGSVGTKAFPDFGDLRLGAGLGVRYLTPFGPLRLDVGVPLDRRPGDPAYGIYAGIGQAF